MHLAIYSRILVTLAGAFIRDYAQQPKVMGREPV